MVRDGRNITGESGIDFLEEIHHRVDLSIFDHSFPGYSVPRLTAPRP
jgi:hypothetical protein